MFCSVFQPIFGLPWHRPVGYEALLRRTSVDGGISVPSELERPQGSAEFSVLDRRTHRLHLASAAKTLPSNKWLFLNIAASTISRPGYAKQLASYVRTAGLCVSQIVLELLEAQGAEIDLHQHITDFRSEGFLIALDDFGVGYSNLARLIRLRPDIVKLDRSLLTTEADGGHLLGYIVRLLHEKGILIVAEGVETSADLGLLVKHGVDFAQGYFLGRPHVAVAPDSSAFEKIQAAYEISAKEQSEPGALEAYGSFLRSAALDLATGQSLQKSCGKLAAMPNCIGCFELDSDGSQVGTTLRGAAATSPIKHFVPIENLGPGRWDNREYFRRAFMSPGTVALSRPRPTIFGGQTCVTLGIVVQTPSGMRLLGIDIKYPLASTRSERSVAANISTL